jgi:ATPases with chaperone activity, ATP-binding subunit
VIGRRNEIERVIQVLCRRTKNNPVLIGEAGVGKTASPRDWRRKSQTERAGTIAGQACDHA